VAGSARARPLFAEQIADERKSLHRRSQSGRSDIRVARMRLVFEQIRSGGDRNFGYLLGDRDAGAGVLVDPSYSPDVFVERARAQSLTITHIINTHSHPDHTNGNDRAIELTGAPLTA